MRTLAFSYVLYLLTLGMGLLYYGIVLDWTGRDWK